MREECKCEDKNTDYHLLNCCQEKCENCEHNSDSSQEYCGTCESGNRSNWSEAGWIKDRKIKRLTIALETIIDFSKMGTSTEHSVLKIAKEALTEVTSLKERTER